MKKLLMICFDWPPSKGVGWHRVSKFAKYLVRFGWEPVILTVERGHQQGPFWEEDEPGNSIRVVRTDFYDRIDGFKRRFLGSKKSSAHDDWSVSDRTFKNEGDGVLTQFSGFFREMIAMPDEKIGWKRYALEKAMDITKNEEFHAVFSTSPPETAHLVAYEVKKQTGLPWIADLRDLWSGYHFYYRGFVKTFILSLLEKRVLGKADAVVIVSEPWAEELRRLHGRRLGDEKIYAITNGYDEEDYPACTPKDKTDKFSIVYTGKLHKELQDPTIFFESLSELIKEGKIDKAKVEADFYVYGYDKPDIMELASRYSLENCVFEKGMVSHKRCMEILQQAQALLFFGWSGRGAYGHHSAKVFEYIGARRPIIAVLRLRSSSVEDLIRQTNSGYIAWTKDELKSAILNLYGEYLSNGRTLFNGDESKIEKYSRAKKTEELTHILDKVTKVQER